MLGLGVGVLLLTPTLPGYSRVFGMGFCKKPVSTEKWAKMGKYIYIKRFPIRGERETPRVTKGNEILFSRTREREKDSCWIEGSGRTY